MRSKTPKMLHDLCGWPIVRWPVEAAREAGADLVVVVGGPERALDGRLPDGVELAVQQEPRGTGDAVKAAAEHIGEGTVIVLNGDVPLIPGDQIAALARAHEERGAAATMVTMVLDEPGQYGRVLRDKEGDVVRVVEAKADGDATEQDLAIKEVNTGVFAFDGPKLLRALEAVTPDNAQGEYYLPDVLPILRDDGHTVAAHVVDDPTVTLGINDRVDLSAVRQLAQRRIQEQHMLAGVTIVDPASTDIDVTVTIARDTMIEPFTTLRGQTAIGEDCVVGPHAHLVDSTLEEGVRLGPYVHLRGGTVVRRNAKVGTFVEMKNSDIGEGTKVPHLSYLGDADVGANTNIAAANVTANYDGKSKHRTTIGDNVRTGVDNTFVAPVTIGDEAVIAAGSVITDDVPPGALAIARERQTNKDGYARRKG
jgi:bifunctional UDP-N-acetylglucosamine pyrophosphorylase/glucosamine-1-phosphate N-acetyltransferase